MSALAVVIENQAVHLIADGGAFDRDGKVLHAVQKVLPLPHMGIAVGARGPVPVIADILFGASHYRSLEELLEGFPAALRAHFDRMIAIAVKAGETPEAIATLHFDVIVAGMDKRRTYPKRTPFAMLISSWLPSDERSNPPFEWMEIEAAAWASPPISDLAHIGTEFQKSPEQGAKALLEEQRRVKGFHMGVYGQVTTIRREGIASRVVCRWED